MALLTWNRFGLGYPSHIGYAGNLVREVFATTLRGATIQSFAPRNIKIPTKEDVSNTPFEPGVSTLTPTKTFYRALHSHARPQDGDEERVQKLLAELPTPASLAGYRLNSLLFEKDDTTNFHMDFIVAASNLRARNYLVGTFLSWPILF